MEELKKILMEQLELLEAESWKAAKDGAYGQLADMSHEMAGIARLASEIIVYMNAKQKPEESA